MLVSIIVLFADVIAFATTAVRSCALLAASPVAAPTLIVNVFPSATDSTLVGTPFTGLDASGYVSGTLVSYAQVNVKLLEAILTASAVVSPCAASVLTVNTPVV